MAERKGEGRAEEGRGEKLLEKHVSPAHIVQFLSELQVPKRCAYFPKLKTTLSSGDPEEERANAF